MKLSLSFVFAVLLNTFTVSSFAQQLNPGPIMAMQPSAPIMAMQPTALNQGKQVNAVSAPVASMNAPNVVKKPYKTRGLGGLLVKVAAPVVKKVVAPAAKYVAKKVVRPTAKYVAKKAVQPTVKFVKKLPSKAIPVIKKLPGEAAKAILFDRVVEHTKSHH